ncbi:voltage-gated hydrogen channel 1 isoform X3 [Mustela lutreola]|uniref:voltage-gated hydrogen channel 1 isoform X3 n=1 Tax=Mustela lutreola TaxID=9666 RepID=UPI0027974372|nr:voltage-gated hydrogen channel 1 isoform X3 [Mustela lutreola]XP_058996733.1 voltage-gated hydrogen channel 1 isoform X3 [Mustela lutreola]XP_058996734.1 voltage-gated hydrogen channel 1 isoform X3 [Mustela lutreola]XP_058996738.1 voltage-gated hydrogen channel 1 isoform X3 [Mustela lutreola]
MATWDEKASSRRARAAPTRRMSKFLKHFTVVGDDYHAWNINYKKWENEEDEEDEEQTPQATASGEQGRAPDPTAAPDPAPRPPLDFRATLRKLFSSHRFQVIIICLVILDALLVLAELILDLKIIELDKNDYAAKVFHYMSFAILTFFMMEIFFKLFVFRMEFFHHKFEILDAFVVLVSFILDFILLFQKHQFEALGLLILLRLWRVARIINGMSPVLSGHRGTAGWAEPGTGPRGHGSSSSWLVFSREKMKWSDSVSHHCLCGYKFIPSYRSFKRNHFSPLGLVSMIIRRYL